MKKLILVFAVILVSGVSLMAQSLKKTSVVKEDEVPVAVRLSFENDFGKIPEEGNWVVTFVLLNDGGKTTAKPLWYTYSKKSKGDKIEVRYLPEGKLESSKGLDKISNTGSGASSTKTDS